MSSGTNAPGRSRDQAGPGAPLIMGIVNITEDSFSDGGRYLDAGAALRHANALCEAGADIIDLGPASSHPDSEDVPADEEVRRIAPVLKDLVARGRAVSVDSSLAETQVYALAHGAAYLNDIQGFSDPETYPVLAEADAKLIVMHSVQAGARATRVETDPASIMKRIEGFFDARIETLESAGIARDRLIIDPGMGFFLGTNEEVSFEVLRHIGDLKSRYGVPVLISVSRKSFLRARTGTPLDRIGAATLAAEIAAAVRGADIIRTHDAGALCDALTIWAAINGGPGRNPAD